MNTPWAAVAVSPIVSNGFDQLNTAVSDPVTCTVGRTKDAGGIVAVLSILMFVTAVLYAPRPCWFHAATRKSYVTGDDNNPPTIISADCNTLYVDSMTGK